MIGHLRSPLVIGAVALGVVVLVSGCGTSPGAQQAGASETTGQDLPEQPGAPAVPTTDDPSLLTVEAPQQTTLDTAQAAGASSTSTAVGADGLELAVVSAECGVPGVRSDGYSVRAAGQFCLLTVDVVNRGTAPLSFDPTRTALVDTEGGTAAPSPEALALPALAAVAAQLPGASALTGTLVFDVPAGADVRAVELDGGASAELPPLG